MKKLERKEIKKVNGGFGPRNTLWRCQYPISPSGYVDVCNPLNPEIACDHPFPCTAIGSCNYLSCT